MPAQIVNIEDIRAKHGYQIPRMMESIMELGKWMEDVEGRLIREGKLKIVNGKYRRLDPATGKALK